MSLQKTADPTEKDLLRGTPRLLEPIDRISEILFGLIMVLTFTCTLGVVTHNAQVKQMLVAALGCNLAWGIIDGGVYLLTRLNDRGQKIKTFRALLDAPDAAAARQILSDALPPFVASVMTTDELENVTQKLRQLPEQPSGQNLLREHGLSALAICALSFLSTFPVVIPFVLITNPEIALRTSNVIAIAMLFLCGYALGRYSGLRPWLMGMSMVAFGCVLVGVAIALGG